MNTTNLHIPSNKVRDIERYILTELNGLYPESELRQFARMLFEAYLGWNTVDYLLHRDSTINQSDLLRFHWAVEDLKQHRPIQHIIGYTEFCDCRIQVSPEVLIPRPETEEIVLSIPPTQGTILDLCTGSGCIAIALTRRNPEAQVSAVDLSDAALKMARSNAALNNTHINFHQIDVLDNSALNECFATQTFNLIVSNPPYVMQQERSQMDANVLDYEPGMALWVEDNAPLVFYESIAQFAQQHLTKDGLLVLEINENLSNETASLLSSYGFECQIRTDFRNKPRSLFCQFPSSR